MQKELNSLKPELIIASSKTEKLMIKIEQDTVIVEKKKEARIYENLYYFDLQVEIITKNLDCRCR